LSLGGVGAWRPYEPYLSAAMDDLDSRLGLARLLGHAWRADPPHVAVLLLAAGETRADETRAGDAARGTARSSSSSSGSSSSGSSSSGSSSSGSSSSGSSNSSSGGGGGGGKNGDEAKYEAAIEAVIETAGPAGTWL